MSELRLHRVAILLPYARFLDEIGAPVESGFRRARLPYDCLDDPNNYVPSQSFYGFVADMAHRERMPYLGFHVGQSFGASCADPNMAQLLCSSPTMLSGLEKACELTNKTISRCEIGLIPAPGGERVLFYHRPGCSWRNPAAGQIAWFGIMAMLGMIRTFAGVGWRPTEIGLMAEGRPDRCVWNALPDTRIRMNQPFSWISIPADYLACSPRTQPTGEGERGTYQPLDESLVGSLRQVLRSFVLHNLEIDAFAELLGTSRRSLQRRLMREGTMFSKLREEARFEKAREILTDPNVSITELASALGYRHPTHFSRAFRRIAGMSPRQYRRARAISEVFH